jgi:DNA mismatch endonuclease (patch repair protein)
MTGAQRDPEPPRATELDTADVPNLPSAAVGVSARMSRQRRRDTAPELNLRRALHRRGLRYRVDLPLPGLPRRRADIVFTRARIAIFVDGCFWHSCPDHATRPSHNAEWWSEKLARNVARDRETDERLTSAGWTVMRFWEHADPVEAADAVEAAWLEGRNADDLR